VTLLLDALHDTCRHEHAMCLKVEPPLRDSVSHHRMFTEWGFRRGDEIQPRSTIVLDLSPDLETLSGRLDIKTRYNVGLASRRGVRIVEAGDDGVAVFYSILQATSQRADFSIHSLQYYDRVWTLLRGRNMAQLLLATYDDEILAGAMLFKLARNAYYMYGASSGRRRNLKPSDLLQWECIRWAKSAGCTTYDMWGIPDEVGQAATSGGNILELLDKNTGNGGPSDNGKKGSARGGVKVDGAKGNDSSLWGVYRFKRGFGGEVVRFVGAYDYVYSAKRYNLWIRSVPLVRQFISKVGRVRHFDKAGVT
jgi:lipid II:glycine glycyltransferase (peptidoglycan interpeptide bridge formation enzyme)